MIQQETSDDYKKKFEFVEAMAELDAKEKAMKSSQGYGKAYFWSVFLPPIGVYYFVRYLFFDDGDRALVSLLVSFLLMGMLFQGNEITKELITPEKQKEILQLYK